MTAPEGAEINVAMKDFNVKLSMEATANEEDKQSKLGVRHCEQRVVIQRGLETTGKALS